MLNRTMSNGAFGTDTGNRTLRRTFGGTFIGVVFHTRRLFPGRVRVSPVYIKTTEDT